MHIGDFNAVEPMRGYDMIQMAHLYWRNEFKTSVEG